MPSKMCSRCKEEKPLMSFSKDKEHHTGYKSACKHCASKDFKRWRELNLEQARYRDKISQYTSKYNLSIEKAEQLVKTNRLGVCQICNEEKKLVVDHCHKTGLVRGFICSHCNSVLGYSNDNKETLLKAAVYLESFYG